MVEYWHLMTGGDTVKKIRTWAGLLVLVAVLLAGCAEKDIPPKPEDGVLVYAALNESYANAVS